MPFSTLNFQRSILHVDNYTFWRRAKICNRLAIREALSTGLQDQHCLREACSREGGGRGFPLSGQKPEHW